MTKKKRKDKKKNKRKNYFKIGVTQVWICLLRAHTKL